jgi:large subunit ribosomal protein L15
MDLFDVRPHPKARKERKRIGRGPGTGNGKLAGRGMKGQNSRAGGGVRPGFEGGQNPLYMRIPKLRGTSNKSHNIGMFRHDFAVLNVGDLDRFESGAEITPDMLKESRIVKDLRSGLKILGEGELSKKLTVKASAFSASAREKIEKAGGIAEVI